MKTLVFSFTFMLSFAYAACNQAQESSVTTKKEVQTIEQYLSAETLEGMETAIVAGGCFWCVEAAFQQIEGIKESISGYTGGHLKYPTYGDVTSHTTGHAEAVYLVYDPEVISYDQILDIFFVAHDPTTLNRQGNDVGDSYRSALYFKDENQSSAINQKIETLNASKFGGKIVTEVTPEETFWVAEAYHQDFYWINPNQSYVRAVSRPKVEKVAKVFSSLLKK